MGNIVLSDEQIEVIRIRVLEARMTHRSERIVQMTGVSQPRTSHFKACFMGPFKTIAVLDEGDGGNVPKVVTFAPTFLMPNMLGGFTPYARILVNNSIQVHGVTDEEMLAYGVQPELVATRQTVQEPRTEREMLMLASRHHEM